jgi:hypothetical protein
MISELEMPGMALSGTLGRSGRESGSEDPVSGRDAPKTPPRVTAFAAREKSHLGGVASSVTMQRHRSAPSALPGGISRSVTGVSSSEIMT